MEGSSKEFGEGAHEGITGGQGEQLARATAASEAEGTTTPIESKRLGGPTNEINTSASGIVQGAQNDASNLAHTGELPAPLDIASDALKASNPTDATQLAPHHPHVSRAQSSPVTEVLPPISERGSSANMTPLSDPNLTRARASLRSRPTVRLSILRRESIEVGVTNFNPFDANPSPTTSQIFE